MPESEIDGKSSDAEHDAGQLQVPVEGLPEPPSVVRLPTVSNLPSGYRYGVTRFADLIMRDAFSSRFNDLVSVLADYTITVDELLTGGGNRASMTARFDQMLADRGWGKRNITISKLIDDRVLHATRGHEIDMFGAGSQAEPYPGIAIEMEWNNKDPFFDRDLLNFMALHREGALAVGVIVTRGPRLQHYIGPVVTTGRTQKSKKYGASTTHWDKIIPRLNLGGGGECPILVVGIEPERILGFERIVEAHNHRQNLWA